MKILITETQRTMITELMWKDTIFNHIKAGRFLLTKKIINALSEEHVVTTFHISSIDHINNVKQLIGTKKVLSTFTYMREYMLENLSGIQTDGGFIYEIKGKLVLHAQSDIMSRPDENGNRWIDAESLLPENIMQEWIDYIGSDYFERNVKMLNDKSYGENRTNFVRSYINTAQSFVLKHAERIKEYITYYGHWGVDWNEVLVTDINVHDILWVEDRLMKRYNKIKKRYKPEYFHRLTDREKYIINNFEQWKDRIKNKLESIATGTVYSLESPDYDSIVNFIEDRGGFGKRSEYVKSLEKK